MSGLLHDLWRKRCRPSIARCKQHPTFVPKSSCLRTHRLEGRRSPGRHSHGECWGKYGNIDIHSSFAAFVANTVAAAAVTIATAALTLAAAALAAAAAAAKLPRRGVLSCDAGHTDLGE